MTLTRLLSWTLLLAAGFALLPRTTRAQDKDQPLPSKSSTAFSAVKALQEKPRPSAEEIAQGREHMKTFAQFYADFIAHDLIYAIVRDPSKRPPGVYPDAVNIDKQIAELGRYLLEPHINNRTGFGGGLRVTADNIDYIREMGKALDEALIKVVNENPKQIVKVNAMRMYVSVCKTGAPAHWPTVTKLLSDPKTPPAIRVYALQAASNLLWAYDPQDYQSRRHSIGSKTPRLAADQEIGALVKAVEDCITKPSLLVAELPKVDLEQLPPGEKERYQSDVERRNEVIRYMRREAIRALGQVRFVMLPGPGPKGEMLYPAHTLARVCVSDPALGPAPSASECAEAVIGLCNMAPVWERKPVENFNANALALAVARGLERFATPRTNPQNKELPWIGYALRLSEALKNWPPIFNFLHDPLKPNPADAESAPAVIKELIHRAENSLLTPLAAKGGGPINLTDLQNFIKEQEGKKGVGVLFTGNPQLTLPGYQKP